MERGRWLGGWWLAVMLGMVGAGGADHLTFKYDPMRTGYTEEELLPPLALHWKFATKPDPRNTTTVIVQGNRVFYCAHQTVYALDAETGSEIWKYNTQSDIRTTPAYADGLLFVGSDAGSLYVLNADNGKLEWEFSTQEPVRSPPVVVEGVVYFASSRQLFGVDLRTRKEVWRAPLPVSVAAPLALDVAGGLIYFTSAEGHVCAYDFGRDALLWQFPLGRLASPALPAGRYVVATGERAIRGLRPRTGRIAWQLPMEGFAPGAPTFAHGRLFIGSSDTSLYCVDPERGQLLWRQPTGFSIQAPPVVAGQTVYVGTIQSHVFAFSVDGEFLWRYKLNPEVSSGPQRRDVNVIAPPVVANGTLYVLGDDGTIYAFRRDAVDVAPPIIDQFRLVIPASNDRPVYAKAENVREVGRPAQPRRGAWEKTEELKAIPGLPPLEVEALITDEGSGLALVPQTLQIPTPRGPRTETVLVEKIQVLFDGQPVPFLFEPKESKLRAVLYAPPPTRQVVPLSDGKHTVSISAEDWRGNQVTATWEFLVDRRAPRPEPPRPVMPAAYPGGYGQPGVPGAPGVGGPGFPGGFPGGGYGEAFE